MTKKKTSKKKIPTAKKYLQGAPTELDWVTLRGEENIFLNGDDLNEKK